MSIPVGIDLGTTFSSIACYQNGRVEVISDSYSNRIIPSMVYYDPDSGEPFVGHLAYEKSSKCYSNLLKDAKRLIGRKFSEGIRKEWNGPSYKHVKLSETDNGMVAYQIEIMGKQVLKKPEEVSAEVLKYMIGYASEYMGEPVTEAVISVPAYFSGSQRQATFKAAQLAGLQVKRLISEPVAGALHYISEKPKQAKFLVFDFGGGTLDVSLLEVGNKTFDVKFVDGDTMLGGRNIDENLFNHFYIPAKQKIDKSILRSIRRLEQTCISMKEFLSNTNNISKVIDCYDGDTDLELTLNINKFNELNEDVFKKSLGIVQNSLKKYSWTINDIEKVILIGGSSRIPKIRKLLEDLFGSGKLITDLNPNEAVAAGACLQAGIISKRFPCLERYEICELTPMSLGLCGYGNRMIIVIPRHSKLPTSGSSNAVTVNNDQESTNFEITEGERKNAIYNNKLGSFSIEGLPKKIAGAVKFTVTFTLDEDGILTVKATESSTGKQNSLKVIIGEFGLNELQRNSSDEELRAIEEEDEIFEEFITQRNELIKKSRKWIYRNKNAEYCQRCTDFIQYAESLNFRCIDDLNNRFKELKIKLNIKKKIF